MDLRKRRDSSWKGHLINNKDSTQYGTLASIGANGDPESAASAAASAISGTGSIVFNIIMVLAVVVMAATIIAVPTVMFPPMLSDIKDLEAKSEVCFCDEFDADTFAIIDPNNPLTKVKFSLMNLTANSTYVYTFPNKNGTFALLSDIPPPQTIFHDGEFAIIHEFGPTRVLQFDVSTISAGQIRVASWQDQDGIVAYKSDLFIDDVFTIQHVDDLSRKIMFNLSLIDTGNIYTYQWPNKGGCVALLDDIVALLMNATVFMDSTFAVVNDPDVSRRAEFDCSVMVGTKVFTFQNQDGVLALLSDIINGFSDAVFFLYDDIDNTKEARFQVGGLTTNTTRVYNFPDFDGMFVLTTGVQTLDTKTLTNAVIADANGNIVHATHLQTSTSSVDLTQAIFPTAGQHLTYNGTIGLWKDPAGGVGTGAEFPDNIFRIFDDGVPSRIIEFRADLLTGTKVFSLPDLTGVVTLTTGAQSLASKTLTSATITDVTNIVHATHLQTSTSPLDLTTAIFPTLGQRITYNGSSLTWQTPIPPLTNYPDNVFKIHDDASLSDIIEFRADLITGTKVFSLPDLSGVVALTTGAQGLASKTLTSAIITDATNVVHATHLQTSTSPLDLTTAVFPTAGQRITYNGSSIIWETPAGGGGAHIATGLATSGSDVTIDSTAPPGANYILKSTSNVIATWQSLLTLDAGSFSTTPGIIGGLSGGVFVNEGGQYIRVGNRITYSFRVIAFTVLNRLSFGALFTCPFFSVGSSTDGSGVISICANSFPGRCASASLTPTGPNRMRFGVINTAVFDAQTINNGDALIFVGHVTYLV